MAAPVVSAIDTSAGSRSAGGHLVASPAISILTTMAVTMIAEGLLVFGYVKGIYSWPVLVICHAAIVGALGLWVEKAGRAGQNVALPLLTTIAVAATGPIGAIAALAGIIFLRPAPEDRQLLDAWYERIALAVKTDEVTQLYDQVATGRTADLSSAAPQSFSAIIEMGSLADRQSALGIIARGFHPDYLPALMLALKSPEPVIRVQAAAVATRVRVDLHHIVDRSAVMQNQLTPGSATAVNIASQLRACMASGLLDEGDRVRAGAIADRLGASPATSTVLHSLRAPPIIDQLQMEAMMLREGRFSAFRVARRLAKIAAAGRFRVRRFGPRIATEATTKTPEAR